MRKVLYLSLITLLLPYITYGQGEANIWYFGDGAGLDFNTNPPTQLEDGNAGLLSATGEGVGSISDADGNILFYTNGSTIYDATHTAMPNGTGLNGSGTTTQTGLIIPVPGSSTEYYVVSTSAGNAVKYVIVDMTLNGGLGDVTVASLNGGNGTEILASPAAEGALVIPEYDGSNVPTGDFWVIFHGTSDANYHVFKADASGITPHPTNPVQTQGFVVPGQPVMVFKTTSCFDKIGVVFYNEPRAEVLPFDVVTGIISAPELILDGLTSGGGPFLNDEVYGLEFSPSGQFLYITEAGLNNRRTIYQFDRTLATGTNPAAVLASKVYYTDGTSNRFGQLQLGPDGQIYFPGFDFSDPTWINVVPNPDVAWTATTPTVADPSEIEMFKYTYNAKKVGEGLPPFLKNLLTEIKIYYNNACEGGTTDFSYVFGGAAVSWSWDFGDPGSGVLNTSTLPTPSHVYSTAGTYTTTLTIIDNCGRTRTGTVDVIVKSGPTYSLPATTCPNTDITITGTGANASNYTWSTDASGAPVLGTGSTYTYNGALPATVYVQDPTPLASHTVGNTGASQSFASDDGHTYFETFTEATIATFDVTTRLNSGTANFSIQSADGITTYGGPYSLTSSASGVTHTITVDLTLAPGTYRIYTDYRNLLYRNNTDDDGNRDVTGVIDVQGEQNGSKGGSFFNIVVDLPDPCGIRAVEIPLNCCVPPTITTQPAGQTVCENTEVNFNVVTTAPSPTYQWQISTDGGGSWTDIPSETSDTYSIDEGSVTTSINNYQYRVQIDQGGCTGTSDPATLMVNPNPILSVTDPSSVCSPTTVDLTAASVTSGSSNVDDPGGYSYWTDASATTAVADETAVGNGTYYIVNVNTDGCSDTAAVNVTINNKPALTITDPTAVCQPNTVDLTAASVTSGSSNVDDPGGYSYWTDAAATTAVADETAVGNGIYYIVNVNTDGCSDTAAVNVTVNNKPALTITDPAAVCQPNTVDISTAAVTAGSTNIDPAGFTYWTDAAATTAMADETAVGNGTYYIVNVNTDGCSDTAAVNVTVNNKPALTITDPAAVCQPNTVDISTAAVTAGSTNIDPAGFTYWTDAAATTAVPDETTVGNGTYYIVNINTDGCSDTAAVNVTVHNKPALTITDPAAVCQPNTVDLTAASITSGSSNVDDPGGYSYWTDAAANTAVADETAVGNGTYYIVNVNTDGCSDTAAVNVTVNNKPALTITDPAAVCQPNTVDISDAALTTGSTNIDPAGFTYWTDAAAATAVTDETSVGNGTYYIVNVNTDGCSDTAAVNVTVNNKPALTITDPAAVCQPNTVDISDAAVTTGSTNIDPAGFSYWTDASATTAVSDETAVGNGTYYIVNVNTDGCSDTAAVNVTVNNKPALTITDPATVCSSSSINLTASSITAGSSNISSLTYWVDANATTSLTTPTAVTTAATYYIVAENSGCYDTAAVNVTIDQLPPVANAGGDASVCVADPINMTGNDPTPGSGLWTIINQSGGISIDNPNLFNSNVSGLDADAEFITAEWRISNGVCPVTADTVTLTGIGISPPSVSLSSSNNSICEGDDITFTAVGINGGTLNIYEFYNSVGDLIQNSTSPSLLINSASEDTSIYVIFRSNSSCLGPNPDSAVSSIESVIVNEIPVLSINDPSPVCTPSIIDITESAITAGSTGGGTLSYWTDAGATVAMTSPDSVNSSGTYYVLANNNGCTDTAVVNITINTTPDLIITDPSPECSPTVIDATDASITAGSSNLGTLTYWQDSEALISETNPTNISNSDTIYVVAENSGCTDTAAIHISITSTPILVTNNPASICTPASVDLTAPDITAGSTGGGSLTYWIDAAATNSLTTPTAVSTSGTYYIVSGSSGCSDTASVVVTVNSSPSLTITQPTTVCSPNTIDITDPSITTGSTNINTITYWADSTAFTSYSTPTAVSASDTIYLVAENNNCYDTSLVIVTIDEIPPTASAGADANVCVADPINMPGNNPIPGTGLWTIISQSGGITIDDVNLHNSSVSGIVSAGDFVTAEWCISNGVCATTCDTVTITGAGIAAPSVSLSAPTNDICVGDELTLSAVGTNGGSLNIYEFYDGQNNLLQSGTNQQLDITGVNDTSIYVIFRSNSSCLGTNPDSAVSSTENITVHNVPVLSITNPDTVCEPSAVDLTIPSITAGSTDSGILSYYSDAGATIPLSSPSSLNNSGTYFILSDNNGCYDTASVDVIINPTPNLTITNPTTVCEPESVDITTNDITSGSTNLGSLYYFNDATATQSISTPSSISTGGAYYIVSSLGGCSDTASVVVNIYPQPTEPTITTPVTYCQNDLPTMLSAIGSNLLWYADSIGGIGSSTAPTPSTNSIGTMTYFVSQTDGLGCESPRANIDITVTAIPNVNAGENSIIEEGEFVTLNGTTDATSVEWTGSADIVDPFSISTLVSPSSQTTYYLTGSIGSCSSTDSVTVFVVKGITIPNAFTPNQDGENDTWVIEGLETYPNATVEVYNRWGSLVYKTTGTYVPWDGFRNGTLMPVHTYYYIITPSPTARPITGSVTLVR